ncbi:MAG: DUF429 domain-containing protein [Synechococcaceae cyanobacterium]|nr:DUF429 domain-containing protein [Synechococcaceae cyanobacterium]
MTPATTAHPPGTELLPAAEGRLLGVDGCRAGWLAVEHAPGADLAEATLHPTARSLADTPGWAWIAIDIPIGLPERGCRTCDLQARQLLGPRRSSVFPAPIRAVLPARSHGEACALSRKVQNAGIPVQAFHLLGKIGQVDRLLRSEPARAKRMVESHPEVAFLVWNGGRPMRHPKRTAAGRAERLALVEQLHPGSFAHIRSRFRRRDVADDDILDALALLRTAGRLARGEALLLGAPGDRDGRGLPMRIAA